jgi:hypothetical protein
MYAPRTGFGHCPGERLRNLCGPRLILKSEVDDQRLSIRGCPPYGPKDQHTYHKMNAKRICKCSALSTHFTSLILFEGLPV